MGQLSSVQMGRISLLKGSIYRISDGHRYAGLEILDVSAGIITLGNVILLIDPTQTEQRLSFALTNSDDIPLHTQQGDQYLILTYIASNNYLAILAEENSWYNVSYSGETGWVSATETTLLYSPN